MAVLWASSEGSGETARMRRLAWTFAARIGDKYQIRLTRSKTKPFLIKYILLFFHAENSFSILDARYVFAFVIERASTVV